MLCLDSTAVIGIIANLKIRNYLSTFELSGRVFYLFVVSYGRLQDDNDDVTVPLLSASIGRQNEEKQPDCRIPAALSIGGFCSFLCLLALTILDV